MPPRAPMLSTASILSSLPSDSATAGDSADATTATTGFVSGAPRLLLRLEAAALLMAALFAYARLDASWATFATLFLLPDLSLLAYLVGPRAGGLAYNAAHSALFPALLALAGLVLPAMLPVALIWLAHIGFDRMLGYGLKYPTSFHATHLGRIGRS